MVQMIFAIAASDPNNLFWPAPSPDKIFGLLRVNHLVIWAEIEQSRQVAMRHIGVFGRFDQLHHRDQ